MIHPQDFEHKIGFSRIRGLISSYAVTQLAKDKVGNISFMTDERQVKVMVSQTNEMKTIVMMENNFPHDGFVDTIDFIMRLSIEGTYLLPDELGALRTQLIGVDALVRFFGRKSSDYPYLYKVSQKTQSFPEIISGINSIIDSRNNVKDTASTLLGEIRSNIAYKEREASKRLQSILRQAISDGVVDPDAQISIRDGKSVIPVSSSNKKKIKGYIQDESATGKTSYIEPIEIIELNNEIRELKYDERHEIVKILTSFTSSISVHSTTLTSTSQYMAAIDLIRAKAKVAIDMDAVMPIINNNKEIYLKSARHPILEKNLKQENKTIVPLDIKLNPTKRILVISGPNAGGKSVCLKTMGLIQYMLQMGMLVPVSSNSELSIFSKIFIDIGDQQSIDNDLSTYSSHLLNMKQIIKHSDGNSLVLIDEFGTGTEPSLGGAIAEVVLQRIEENGAFGVITTHYSNIKYYASNSEHVENGAMAFDVQNISPLFRLEIGKPGSSFAFEIARKIGLPDDIIRSAEGMIGDSQINIERQLRQIARDKNYWEIKREKIKHSERRFEQVENEYEAKLIELKEQKSTILKKARQEAEEIISKANKEIERTIREIKEAAAEKNKTKELRVRIDNFKEELEDFEHDADIERKIQLIKERKERKSKKKAEKEQNKNVTSDATVKVIPITVGSKVKIKGQTVAGIVQSIEKEKATVTFGSINTSVKIDNLMLISEEEHRKQLKSVSNFSGILFGYNKDEENLSSKKFDVNEKRLNFKSDIDLRGLRVDEAITQVQDLVDQAGMLGIRELRILHGKGTGALKTEIRKYLNSQPIVLCAEDAHIEFGGSGITMVTLDI